MFGDEEWRPIEEFPHYEVSSYGRIRHLGRASARAVTINDRGFPVILLYGPGGRLRYLRQVNKLVAVTFLPTPPPPPTPYDFALNSVWHKDGDLTNCRLDNLKWETRAHVLEWNEMHRNGTAKLKTPMVRNNRTGALYDNAYECAIAEGVREDEIVWRIEKQAMHMYDDSARYRYVYPEDL